MKARDDVERLRNELEQSKKNSALLEEEKTSSLGKYLRIYFGSQHCTPSFENHSLLSSAITLLFIYLISCWISSVQLCFGYSFLLLLYGVYVNIWFGYFYLHSYNVSIPSKLVTSNVFDYCCNLHNFWLEIYFRERSLFFDISFSDCNSLLNVTMLFMMVLYDYTTLL